MPFTQPWQFLYNGLLFGADTDYELLLVEGLDPAEIRSNNSARMQAHGDFTFAPFYAGRVLTFKGSSAGDPVQPLMAAWSKALRPQAQDQPLQMYLPHHSVERIYCKPFGKPTYVVDPAFSYGYAEWAFQLVSGNPRIFSDDTYIKSVTPGNSVVVTNAGDFDAHPVMTLNGPIDTPIIMHVETGKFLQLNLMVSAGQVVIIDEQVRTIMLGSLSLYSSLTDTSKWQALSPGDNTFSLAGTSTTGATKLEIEWRNARV